MSSNFFNTLFYPLKGNFNSVLLGPVPLLNISIFVIERSQKIFSNMVTDIIKLFNRNLPYISKYKCNLNSFLRQGISHPEFYCDVIYKLRKILWHIATHFTCGYRSLYSRQPHLSLWLCGDIQGLVIHDGMSAVYVVFPA